MNINDTQILDYLKQNDVEHTIIQTSNSLKIITQNNTFISSNTKLTNKAFQAIKRIKKYVAENVEYEKIKKPKNIHYFESKNIPTKETILQDFVEIDVNSAYFTLALQKNYIDSEILNYVKDDKIARLVGLGSLATTKTTEKYNTDTKKYEHISTITEPTENVFFDISNDLGEIMYEILTKVIPDTQFSFFWVDAIFCHKKNIENVQNFLKSKNLESKIYEIETIEIKETKDFRYKAVATKQDKTTKAYPISNKAERFNLAKKNYKIDNEAEKIITVRSNNIFQKLQKKLL